MFDETNKHLQQTINTIQRNHVEEIKSRSQAHQYEKVIFHIFLLISLAIALEKNRFVHVRVGFW